jgi:mannitol/fructose-specific phosphotransferase system IIA component (Ntr-type)
VFEKEKGKKSYLLFLLVITMAIATEHIMAAIMAVSKVMSNDAVLMFPT